MCEGLYMYLYIYKINALRICKDACTYTYMHAHLRVDRDPEVLNTC